MGVKKACWTQLAAVLLAILLPAFACAHSASSSYLHVDVRGRDLAVQWSIALRDLDYAIGLDTDGNGAITWGELRQHEAAIQAYALARLRLSAGGQPCTPGPVSLLADELSDGGYATLRFDAACTAVPSRVTVHYGLLFDLDPLHRGLLTLSVGGVAHAYALSPTRQDATFDVSPGYGETVRSFFETGIDHLLTGIDHMLFVTMLLVPAMFRRRGDDAGFGARLQPVTDFTRHVHRIAQGAERLHTRTRHHIDTLGAAYRLHPGTAKRGGHCADHPDHRAG